jgi:hypothetical protein
VKNVAHSALVNVTAVIKNGATGGFGLSTDNGFGQQPNGWPAGPADMPSRHTRPPDQK